MALFELLQTLHQQDSAVGNLIANLTRLREPLNLLDLAALCTFVFILLSQLAKSPLRRLLNGMLLFLVVLSAVTAFEGLTALNLFIRNSYLVFLVSIPIIFQSEIRDLLSEFGGGAGVWKRLFQGRSQFPGGVAFIDELVESIRYLQRHRLGALIVIQGQDPLAPTMNRGIRLNSECVTSLLNLIFEKNSLLHDGAVVIRQGRIARANVLFQLQENTPSGDAGAEATGARHLAASAITQHNDALCLVVSEETGRVALSRFGVLYEMEPSDLAAELYHLLHAQRTEPSARGAA